VGTSSNAPKETKGADGKDEQSSLGKPVIWAGMFITNKLNPVICLDDAAPVEKKKL
jgi:hypothetical protein